MIEKHLLDCLTNIKARSILDVGPGYSNFSRIAAQITGASKIVFIDCDEQVLVWQISETKRENIDAESVFMPLASSAVNQLADLYDIILCQEVLEHLPDAEEVLRSLANKMAPSGRIVITVPTKKSERWLKWLNPEYMRDEPYGHVREFGELELRKLLGSAGLVPTVFIPTQPHYFVAHTWFCMTRMRVEGSTGRVLTGGVRGFVFEKLLGLSKKIFLLTGSQWWGRLIPRNFFVIAGRAGHENNH